MDNAYEKIVFNDLQKVTEKLVRIGHLKPSVNDTVGFETNSEFIQMMSKEYSHKITFEVLWGSSVLFSKSNMPITVLASSICKDSHTPVYLRYNIAVEDWIFPFDLIILSGEQIQKQLEEQNICK